MKRKLGLPSAIAVVVGLIVASSCLLSLGQGIGLAGKGFLIAMLIVVILNACLALSFSELHDLMPEVDGGMGQYTKVGLGSVPSIIANLSAYVVVNLLAASVEIAMCGIVVNELFLPSVPAPVISVCFLAVLMLVNYNGIDIFSKIQNVVVGLLLLSILGMGIISFFKLGTGEVITQQTAPAVTGIGGYVSLSAMAFWLFIGIEFVIPVAKELKNPKRDVLLSMILGISLLFVLQSLLGAGMTNYVTYADLASSEMPHMVFAHSVLGKAGETWMGIVTILAGISTANTVLGGIPSVLCGMSENDLLPSVFSKKTKKGVALAGLLFIGIGDAALIATGFTNSGTLSTLLLAASCFWLTSYVLINVTVLVLRYRYPGHPSRNKKLVFFGIPQILAILGDIYMIANIAEGAARLTIYKMYFVILAVLLVYAVVWMKFVKKQPLFTPATLEDVNPPEKQGSSKGMTVPA
ncbi:APC family permease [Blautia schinkii]|nr:APC family permease [Blautia schinkii]